MRPGELCALRRSDVDLKGLEVVVQRTLDGTGREKAPKNGLARRVILPHRCRGNRARPGAHRLALSVSHGPRAEADEGHAGLLLAQHPRWVGGSRRRPIDLYELRHACATMLVERGLNVGDVAFQLGHQDGGRLVMTLYGHPGEDAIRDRLKMAHSQRSRTPSVRSGTSARSSKM